MCPTILSGSLAIKTLLNHIPPSLENHTSTSRPRAHGSIQLKLPISILSKHPNRQQSSNHSNPVQHIPVETPNPRLQQRRFIHTCGLIALCPREIVGQRDALGPQLADIVERDVVRTRRWRVADADLVFAGRKGVVAEAACMRMLIGLGHPEGGVACRCCSCSRRNCSCLCRSRGWAGCRRFRTRDSHPRAKAPEVEDALQQSATAREPKARRKVAVLRICMLVSEDGAFGKAQVWRLRCG